MARDRVPGRLPGARAERGWMCSARWGSAVSEAVADEPVQTDPLLGGSESGSSGQRFADRQYDDGKAPIWRRFGHERMGAASRSLTSFISL